MKRIVRGKFEIQNACVHVAVLTADKLFDWQGDDFLIDCDKVCNVV